MITVMYVRLVTILLFKGVNLVSSIVKTAKMITDVNNAKPDISILVLYALIAFQIAYLVRIATPVNSVILTIYYWKAKSVFSRWAALIIRRKMAV